MNDLGEVLPIRQLGDPVLRQRAKPIGDLGTEGETSLTGVKVEGLAQTMLSTLAASNGVGLAAPQIGMPVRVLVIASRPNLRYPHAPEMAPEVLFDPELVSYDSEQEKDWEGCLSVPGIRGLVPRFRAVRVAYGNRRGERVEVEFHGFVARIFQHEFDHLEGKVFLDRVESTLDLVTEQEYQKIVESRR